MSCLEVSFGKIQNVGDSGFSEEKMYFSLEKDFIFPFHTCMDILCRNTGWFFKIATLEFFS